MRPTAPLLASLILLACSTPTLISTETHWSEPDAMWDWWAKPDFLRHGDTSYLVVTEAAGPVSLLTVRNGQVVRSRLPGDFQADDHNPGSVVVGDGRIAVFTQGRTIKPPADNQRLYYAEGAIGDDLSQAELKSTAFGSIPGFNSNYPNTYNSVGAFFDISRIQTGLGDQWAYVLNTWPLTDFSQPKPFYRSALHVWPYFATARSGRDPETIALALGYHPISGDFHDIFYGEIHRGGVHPWDVVANGKTIANLSTGAGLPLSDGSLELVYSPPPGESLRLFNVVEGAVVFSTFRSDGVGLYQYAVRTAVGRWRVSPIVSAGLPFHGQGVRNYYGGASISDVDPQTVTLSREADGHWFLERYRTTDLGTTWVRLSSIDYGTTVAARPESEQLAEESYGQPLALATAYWFGYYDPTDYTHFLTTLTVQE